MKNKNMKKEKEEKIKYYSLENIKKENAYYNIIIGERSNGKTFAVLKESLEMYCKTGFQFALIKRMKEDLSKKNCEQLFENLIKLGLVEKFSNGKWNSIFYFSRRWYLCKYETNKDGLNERVAVDTVPMGFWFCLSGDEHEKMSSYSNVRIILFDEFLTRNYYLPNEWLSFTSIVSTIVRNEDKVKIYMTGNTVNKYCPYFSEMGLRNIKKQKQGTIDVYLYGDSKLKVAVEYCANLNKENKKSNVYFAFDNPRLKMITHGEWEIENYPHLPCKYKPKDILYTYFIKFDNEILQCEIININDLLFTFIHRKTSPIKENEKIALVYQQEPDARPNYRRKITKAVSEIEKRISMFFIKDKVFYQDNDCGEIVRNYLRWCRDI